MKDILKTSPGKRHWSTFEVPGVQSSSIRVVLSGPALKVGCDGADLETPERSHPPVTPHLFPSLLEPFS